MKTITLLTTEELASDIKNPVLIVDKEGVIGRQLILKLGKDVQVVFATRSKPIFPSEYSRNIVHVPFIKKFPTIPDGKYSYLFIIDNRLSDIKELLPSFASKAEKERIPALFVTEISETNEDFMSLAQSKYSSFKILVCGDIFDKSLSLDQNATINRFLYETFAYERIEVPGSGMAKTYPVYLDDVILGILEVMFGNVSGETQVFFAFPKHAPTALSVARAIQRARPEVKVDFSNTPEEGIKTIPASGIYLLEDDYPFEERIKTVVLKGPKQELDKTDFEKYIKQKATEIPHESRFPIWSIILSFVFILILPFITSFVFSFLGLASLYKAQSDFSKGNINGAIAWASPSHAFFSFAGASYKPLFLEANFVGLGNAVSPIGQNIDAGKDISKAALSFADAYRKLSAVLSGKTNNAAKDFADANLELSDALVLIRKVEGSKDVDKNLIARIRENDRLLNFAANIQSVLPQLIGVSGKRTYLFLFQNNMELRPTGGFIGSYGLMRLSSGKVESFEVADVYDADGQLKGHVEPPFAIRRYLPSEHWYLRDSNFDLDFQKAASTSAFFLKTEKGIDVDGVVGVDVSFIQKILKATGGIYVTEYNQDVNADNFFKLAQEHSEKNFFPGSTQKKDFLGAVFRALQNRLIEKKDVSYMAIAKVVEESILSKDILLASVDSSVQGLFTVNNWSSSLFDNREQVSGTVNDYLGINEANLGVNKANYFVERKITQNSIINDEGKITSELGISYTNKSNGWPGGDYKNYLRVIVPAGSVLSSITINGEEQKIIDAVTDPLVYEKKGFTPPAGLEIESSVQDGKQIWGLLLPVLANSKKTITFDYILPEKIDVSSSSSTYNLKLLKQPGIDKLPFDFTLSYPSSQTIVSLSPGFNKQNGAVVFNLDVTKDESLVVSFAKNE